MVVALILLLPGSQQPAQQQAVANQQPARPAGMQPKQPDGRSEPTTTPPATVPAQTPKSDPAPARPAPVLNPMPAPTPPSVLLSQTPKPDPTPPSKAKPDLVSNQPPTPTPKPGPVPAPPVAPAPGPAPEPERPAPARHSGGHSPAAPIPPGPTPPFIQPETTRKVKKATAYLKVVESDGTTAEGSGFFGVESGLVLTNAHVVGMLLPQNRPPKKIDVVVQSGTRDACTFDAQVLGVDRENDLALLRVKGDEKRLPEPLPVELGECSLTELQKVYIFGFPLGVSLGKEITAAESSVSSFRKDGDGELFQIQVNGGMHPGNSGGPVVDGAASSWAWPYLSFAAPRSTSPCRATRFKGPCTAGFRNPPSARRSRTEHPSRCR